MTPMEFGPQYPQIEEGTSKDVWVEGTGDSGNPSRLFYVWSSMIFWVTDADNFQFLVSRGQLQPHTLPRSSIKERSGNGRQPTHPAALAVCFINPDNAIMRLFSGAFTHRHSGAKSY